MFATPPINPPADIINRISYKSPDNGRAIKEVLERLLKEPRSTEDFIKGGILEAMRETMNFETDTKILLDCCWILTNISSECSEPRIAEYYLDNIMNLIFCSDLGVAHQAMWLASNIAGDGYETSRLFLEEQQYMCIIDKLLSLRAYDRNDHSQVEMIDNGIRTLLNLCRYEILPDIEVLKKIIDIMEKFIGPDYPFTKNILFCLKTILIKSPEMVSFVFDMYHQHLINVCDRSLDTTEIWLSVTIIGLLVGVSGDEMVDRFLEKGILNLFSSLIGRSDNTDKDILWCLSNIVRGTDYHVTRFIDSNLLSKILPILSKRNASRAIVIEGSFLISDLSEHEAALISLTSGQLEALLDIVVKRMLTSDHETTVDNAANTLWRLLRNDLTSSNVRRVLLTPEYERIVSEVAGRNSDVKEILDYTKSSL
jgi:hypothetical protein